MQVCIRYRLVYRGISPKKTASLQMNYFRHFYDQFGYNFAILISMPKKMYCPVGVTFFSYGCCAFRTDRICVNTLRKHCFGYLYKGERKLKILHLIN